MECPIYQIIEASLKNYFHSQEIKIIALPHSVCHRNTNSKSTQGKHHPVFLSKMKIHCQGIKIISDYLSNEDDLNTDTIHQFLSPII